MSRKNIGEKGTNRHRNPIRSVDIATHKDLKTCSLPSTCWASGRTTHMQLAETRILLAPYAKWRQYSSEQLYCMPFRGHQMYSSERLRLFPTAVFLELVTLDILGSLPRTKAGKQFAVIMTHWYTKTSEDNTESETNVDTSLQDLLHRLENLLRNPTQVDHRQWPTIWL